MNQILTPKDRPDHSTIGRYFAAWDGGIYYCDSYDPAIGFWMTNIEAAVAGVEVRRNVSERAIGRTFHRIYEDVGEPHTALGGWTGREKFKTLAPAHRARLEGVAA